MPLKIQKPNVHDNTDGELIIINKSKLSNHLHLIKSAAASFNNVLGWLGLSVAFILPALLAEKYVDIGPLTGDVIRAILMALGIVGLGFFIYSLVIWYKIRKKHDPDVLVSELLQENPVQLRTILYQITEEPIKNKKRGEVRESQIG